MLLARLEQLGTIKKLLADEVLFEQGETSNAAYLVQSGALAASVLTAGGRKMTLEIHREGALVGEIALFDDGPRTATISAHGDAELLRISRSDLLKAVGSDPDLFAGLLQLAGTRMRYLTEQVQQQSLLPLQERLARKLLHLTKSEGTETLTMSHAALADFLAVTREAVSRVLLAWKKAGVIELERGKIVLIDREALVELAETENLS